MSQTDNPDWLAVGLSTALKAALMSALSSYENAEPEDILDTDRKGAASIRLLLRRASSTDYLSDDHRLPLTSSKRRAILRLVELRNQTLHILSEADVPEASEVGRLALVSVDAVEHLMLTAPAFETKPYAVDLALIADYVKVLRDRMEA